MGLTDFFFGVLTSITANRLDEPLRRLLHAVDREAPEAINALPAMPSVEAMTTEDDTLRRFRTFDILHDLDAVISVLQDPKVHILIEDIPSTAYCLPAVVLQSTATAEWYVFRRGRFAFQGTGGGLANSRTIVDNLKKRGVPISAWVIRRNDLDAVEAGKLTWPVASRDTVPILAAPGTDYMWDEIARNVKKIVALPHPGSL
ncbi:hypothetical protein [Dyella sp. Tek66A03]|uniref:hypothetical protein n=1 Tax=Dyella sp. Tek66A03 TaxID=3458298 RepID=UPI00403E5B32